jgi:hypothetical protein
LSSEQKYPKLVFKRSIDRLKPYIYYLLLVVGAGVARAGCTSAIVASVGGASAGGGWTSPAMVAGLQATAAAVLTNLAAAALSVLVGGKGGKGVLVLALACPPQCHRCPRPVLLLLAPFCRLPHLARRRHVVMVSRVTRPLLHRRQPIRRRPPLGHHELPS